MVDIMVDIIEIETKRLILRQWLPEDFTPFAELNADPAVMKYYPTILSKSESDMLAKKVESLIAKKGWGFWAVELKSIDKFIGFIGLHAPEVKLPFMPCVEIGWRLSFRHWGNGYATEGATAALTFAFETLKLDDVVSFTSLTNNKSKAVMERLHMINVNQNFEHPNIPKNHYLREHILYKISQQAWRDSNNTENF